MQQHSHKKSLATVRQCLIILFLCFVSNTLWAHEDHVDVSSCAQYLGNEGILVSHGDTKVLFDAFYADSYGQYALVKSETRKKLLAGEAPFDGVSALFVSHVHGDHFSVEPTIAYLKAHPEVTLYASQQVVSKIQLAGGVPEKQLYAFRLNRGDTAQSAKLGELVIDVVRIPHAGWPQRADIENLAFRVSIDGALTILHLGDADPNEEHFSPYREHWDAKILDTAFPPYWFFGDESGRRILNDHLKAQQAIGIHVPEAAEGDGDSWRQRFNADLFTDRGEIRMLGQSHCSDEDH